MYRLLASHNDDINRLVEKGYAVAVDSTNYLIVRDIPYLDSNGALQIGAFVTDFQNPSGHKIVQSNHQVWFAGSHPHNLDGTPIQNISGHNVCSPLGLSAHAADVVVQRHLSNKPIVKGQKVDYPDFFAKIENYKTIISGPAIAKYPDATPYTFNVRETNDDSVFKIRDTLTSRAVISDLAQNFKDEVIAIIGLGGTGAYVLEFISKTPVKEIRGFDGDVFHKHNQFRSPGAFKEEEFGKKKADVYQARYENLRENLKLVPKYIDSTCGEDLDGVTFAFVCVDKGASRQQIFDLLIAKKIKYIDVGMGLKRKKGALSGQLRATYYSPDEAAERKAKGFAPLTDQPNAEYRINIQIGELNAMNAFMAVFKYKKLKGFYFDDLEDFHFLFRVGDGTIVKRTDKNDDQDEDEDQ